MEVKETFIMKFAKQLLLLLLLFLPNENLTNSVRLPNSNARDAFACNLFQSLVYREQNYLQPIHQIVLLSPASMQKMFAVFYNNSELEHMRPLARDLGLLDSSLFTYSHYFQVNMDRRLQMLDGKLMPIHFIQPYLVMDLFAKDFDELGDDITIENYFIIDGGLEIARGFRESAWDYFNIMILPKYQPVVAGLMHEFGLNTRSLEIYSSVSFHAYLSDEFLSMQHYSYGRGYFRFAESLMLGGDARKSIDCRILEIPLIAASTPKLTLMLVMPGEDMSLEQLESKLLMLKFRSFRRLSNQLRYKQVSVRLPKMKFLSKINVGVLMNEISSMRLHKIFNMEMEYQGMFDNAFNRRIKVQHFVQSINMQLLAPGAERMKRPINPVDFFNVTHMFDCAISPFLFLVRSRDVIYFMGHHRGIPAFIRANGYYGQF